MYGLPCFHHSKSPSKRSMIGIVPRFHYGTVLAGTKPFSMASSHCTKGLVVFCWQVLQVRRWNTWGSYFQYKWLRRWRGGSKSSPVSRFPYQRKDRYRWYSYQKVFGCRCIASMLANLQYIASYIGATDQVSRLANFSASPVEQVGLAMQCSTALNIEIW